MLIALADFRRMRDRPTWHSSGPPVQRHTLLHCDRKENKKKKVEGGERLVAHRV